MLLSQRKKKSEIVNEQIRSLKEYKDYVDVLTVGHMEVFRMMNWLEKT